MFKANQLYFWGKKLSRMQNVYDKCVRMICNACVQQIILCLSVLASFIAALRYPARKQFLAFE